MKRELTRFVLVMSSALLALEYSEAHFGKPIGFVIGFIGGIFATLVVIRLNPLFEKLGWEEYVIRKNSEAILAFPAIILTLLVMISVTHCFPPKDKKKTESAGEVLQIEAEPISADEKMHESGK